MSGADTLPTAIDDLRLAILTDVLRAVRAHADGENPGTILPAGPVNHLEGFFYVTAAAEIIAEVCQEADRRGLADRLPQAETTTDIALVRRLGDAVESGVDTTSNPAQRRGMILVWGGTQLLAALAADVPGEDEMPGTDHLEAAFASAGPLLRGVLDTLPATVVAACMPALGDDFAPICAALSASLDDDAHRVAPEAATHARASLNPALMREAAGSERPVIAMMTGVGRDVITGWIPPREHPDPESWAPRLRTTAFGTEIVE
ncbi:hypothetical protein H8R18_08775 [Nanchangia anserum]|uniref:Uncharacterized protein n=1 Tax=Nanchangia anserum TaxID=2692125 RepID=A0A8I0KW41_9ACTO|nr:hypothetical protein [Nanchangia anserum]MBD3689604.1 hypothetical protein [Nanchangia anserum]QOX81787.1 hypothetical protein H8R18_08775 [Nanchangia anserum]